MTKVNMNKEQFNIGVNDPELPEIVKKASRNHGGMIVPDHFFADFEQKMNAVIDNQSQTTHIPANTTNSTSKSIWRWSAAAAAVVAIAFVGAAFHFDWFESQITEQQAFMASTAAQDAEEELNPSEDIYYTSLSDYEVYDLICGI